MDLARFILILPLTAAVGCCSTNPILYDAEDSVPKRTAMALYFGAQPEDRRGMLVDMFEDLEDCPTTRAVIEEGARCFLDTDTDGKLVEPSPAVRVTAVRILRHLEARDAEGLVRSCLLAGARQDPSAAVRVESVLALRAFGGEKALGALRVALREDADGEVRLAAARELGELGDGSEQTTSALIAGLKDNNTDVRNNARNSLTKLLGGDHGVTAAAWRRWLDYRPDASEDGEESEEEPEPDLEELELPPEEEFGDEEIEPFDEEEDE
jgi:hypothetical protein